MTEYFCCELQAFCGEEWVMRGDQQAEGTSPAVSVLFYRYAAAVHRFAARRLGDGPAADITADVFRIAIERYESFDSRRGHPRAWLFGIAANLIRGHWRTEERHLRALARERGRVASPIDPLLHIDDSVDASAELDRVMLAVAALSPEDRDLLTLFAWEECGYAEIAEALEIPVGTVRSRLHRIRRELATQPVEESNR